MNFFFSEEKILAWYCVNFSSNNRKSPKLRTKMKYSGIVAKPWFCLFESFSYMSFKDWRWNISLLKYFSVENI